MKRAIGIIRVSQVKDREGESFASPQIQQQRIQDACQRDNLQLIQTYDELDVSGGRSLDERPGLSRAIHAIEAGKAEVVIAAYFDRLFRSLSTQAEVIKRVEDVGGHVVAVDVGRISNESATQWLSGTMHGMMAEYFKRSVKERSGEAQARAVSRGVPPYPNTPPGYRRDAAGRLQPDSTAPVVAEAFRMRSQGATILAVRAHLAEHGIHRTFNAVHKLLASRVMLGELRFGSMVNLSAHDPIVDRHLWDSVQSMKPLPKGRLGKSNRLLARLGVLRCGSCGSRMIVGGNNHGAVNYRCSPTGDCPKRCVISATIAERVVSDAVRAALSDARGRASITESAQEATRALATAQEALDTALRVFTLTGAENEPAAVERIAMLVERRDSCEAVVDQIRPEAVMHVSADVDWDRLTLAERRDLIRAVVERVTVAPAGRGAERLAVHLFGQ